MSMFDDYTFEIEGVHPSGIVACNDGRVTGERTFIVRSEYAEELGLRLLGKWNDITYATPVLPAEYPSSRFSMVAKSFTIEPQSACCFNVEKEDNNDSPFITDLTSTSQMEKYWLNNVNSEDCYSVVKVQYAEPEWDCVGDGSPIQVETAISVELNPAYEMFTLPNRNLVWADLTEERELKADSYAYKIIPKSDVIISWYNIPVLSLNTIMEGLKGYRGCVNDGVFGGSSLCDSVPSFEAETLLFIDFEEDRSKRTTGFAASLSDTTTLKLHFKEKDIVEGNDHFGWNHLFLDHSKNSMVNSCWSRVNQNRGGGYETDLFEVKSFASIFTW